MVTSGLNKTSHEKKTLHGCNKSLRSYKHKCFSAKLYETLKSIIILRQQVCRWLTTRNKSNIHDINWQICVWKQHMTQGNVIVCIHTGVLKVKNSIFEQGLTSKITNKQNLHANKSLKKRVHIIYKYTSYKSVKWTGCIETPMPPGHTPNLFFQIETMIFINH